MKISPEERLEIKEMINEMNKFYYEAKDACEEAGIALNELENLLDGITAEQLEKIFPSPCTMKELAVKLTEFIIKLKRKIRCTIRLTQVQITSLK